MITVRVRAVPWRTIDAIAALVLAVLMARSVAPPASGAPVVLGYALATVLCAGVAVRRLLPPVAVFGVAVTASAVSGYLGFGKDPMVALALVLYLVVVRSQLWTAVAALLSAEAAVLIASRTPGPETMPHDAVIATAAVQLAGASIGWALRAHRTATAALREQADRRIQAEIDRASRTLAEERLHIARDLHDIVAHTMSVIAVQATVAGHVLGRRPDAGRAALSTIEETTRTGLGELRLMLQVLRDTGVSVGSVGGAESMAPAPNLAALGGLVARTREVGLAIDLAVSGVPRALPAGVEVSAYRIVQEALTNVVRHAGAGKAHVALCYLDDALQVVVTDDGKGRPGRAPMSALDGHGLVGMRERAAALGGTLQAGPASGGGYRLCATLPVPR